MTGKDLQPLVGAQALANFESIFVGKQNVEQHEVGGIAAEILQALTAAGEAFDFKALFAEVIPHQFYDVAFIFNDDNTLTHGRLYHSQMLREYE